MFKMHYLALYNCPKLFIVSNELAPWWNLGQPLCGLIFYYVKGVMHGGRGGTYIEGVYNDTIAMKEGGMGHAILRMEYINGCGPRHERVG
jgi:hypothetical protein